MTVPAQTERRSSIRVKYASGETCPRLKLLTEQCTVLDASPRSLRVICQYPALFRIGDHVSGSLVFQGGLVIPVDGTIYRKDRDSIVILLRRFVPREILIGSGNDRRTFFRLRYRLVDRPTLQRLQTQWEVTEISEFGVRVKNLSPDLLTPGQPIRAQLTFHDGESVEIEGRVLRVDEDETILHLAKGIPGAAIMKEQRNLIKRARQFWDMAG